MSDDKAQNPKGETAQHVRKPVHAKINAQKSPRERQQHHDPAILRHAIEHRACHSQVVHRMARRKTVLVERRNFGLDLRIRGKRTRTLGAELDAFVNHKAHRERDQRLPKNRQKAFPADHPNQKSDEQSPNIAVTQTHIKLEELRRLRGKMTVRPIHRHAVIKFRNFLEHGCKFRNLNVNNLDSFKQQRNRSDCGKKVDTCSVLGRFYAISEEVSQNSVSLLQVANATNATSTGLYILIRNATGVVHVTTE